MLKKQIQNIVLALSIAVFLFSLFYTFNLYQNKNRVPNCGGTVKNMDDVDHYEFKARKCVITPNKEIQKM